MCSPRRRSSTATRRRICAAISSCPPSSAPRRTGPPRQLRLPTVPTAVYGPAIAAEKRAGAVQRRGIMAKLVEEDPTLVLEQNPGLQEMVLGGQGDIPLQIAMDRLRIKYNLQVTARKPQLPYKETIRKGTAQHARFKRQSGGHGQFAGIQIAGKPR